MHQDEDAASVYIAVIPEHVILGREDFSGIDGVLGWGFTWFDVVVVVVVASIARGRY